MIAHVRLAGAYERSGDRSKAIDTLEELIALDPSFTLQGGSLIQQLRSGEPVDLWVSRQRVYEPPR